MMASENGSQHRPANSRADNCDIKDFLLAIGRSRHTHGSPSQVRSFRSENYHILRGAQKPAGSASACVRAGSKTMAVFKNSRQPAGLVANIPVKEPEHDPADYG